MHPLLRRVIGLILDLNFFASTPPATDPYKLQTQHLATRVFIVSFLVALIILIIHSSVISNSTTFTVEQPHLTEYDQLFSLHSSTLSCPCSQISVPYKTFIHIDYAAHQLCSSDYITNAWIWYLTATPSSTNVEDFRSMAVYLFQALQLLCQLTKDTIEESLVQFYSHSYISAVLTPRDLLHTQTNSTIEQFLSTTTNNFASFLQMMLDTSHVNALFSGLFLNYEINLQPNSAQLRLTSYKYEDDCDCLLSRFCSTKLAIYENQQMSLPWFVPGFYRGCLMFEALRQSRLECFYYQTCLDELDVHLDSPVSFRATPLNASLSTRFHPNTTLGTIIDALMVNEWRGEEIFGQYYDACRPNRCTYTIINKHNLAAIATLMIGLLGGLVTILKLIVPCVVGSIRWVMKPRASLRTEQSLRPRLRVLLHSKWQYLVEFNIFPSNPPSTQHFDLQTQRLSTRIFFIVWLAAFAILVVYTSVMKVKQTYTILSPTAEQFNDLVARHEQTLICPCSQISTSYRSFLTIDRISHPVCSSVFITDRWIEHVTYFDEPIEMFDFRWFSSLTFQAIRAFCQLVDETIRSNRKQFLSDNYISTIAIAKHLFESQVNASVEQFISSTTKTFTRSLKMLRSTTHYSALLSGHMTNYIVILPSLPGYVYSATVMYNGCKCVYTPTCSKPVTIYRYIETVLDSWIVPGFYGGCYVLESLLQSNLECLYNGTCLAELDLHLRSTTSVNATPLQASIASHFMPNTSMKAIIEALMVDRWQWVVDHDYYYRICQPAQCTYTVVERRSVVLIVTVLIGLFGGLTTSLKLIVPRLIWLIRRRLQPRAPALPEATLRQRVVDLQHTIIHQLINLNLFPSYPPSTDRSLLRIQRISTRVFIVIFAVTVVTLLIYTFTVTDVQTFTVSEPDYDQYNWLFSLHSFTLRCSCAEIAASYSTFINVSYSMHPVCHSTYVTDDWIRYLLGSQTIIRTNDFRLTGFLQFQALQSLCQLVVDIIIDQLDDFYSNVYINTEVVAERIFVSEVDAMIDEFISAMMDNFELTLRIIRDVTQVGAFLSALMQNIGVYVWSSSRISAYPRVFNSSCSCIRRSNCVESAALHDATGIKLWDVPGFYFGCFTLESLRQSRFDCFFDQTCVDEMNFYLMNSNETMNLVALDASSLIRFQPNTTVGRIIDELMVNEWKWDVNHEKYYKRCQPAKCTYQVATRNDFIAIITTLLGLMGGLVTALKLTVPRAVFIVLKVGQYKRRNIKRNMIMRSIPTNSTVAPMNSTDF